MSTKWSIPEDANDLLPGTLPSLYPLRPVNVAYIVYREQDDDPKEIDAGLRVEMISAAVGDSGGLGARLTAIEQREENRPRPGHPGDHFEWLRVVVGDRVSPTTEEGTVDEHV